MIFAVAPRVGDATPGSGRAPTAKKNSAAMSISAALIRLPTRGTKSMTTATATLTASSVHGRFRGVGAVLAGLAANVLFATLTDMVMHGLDIFPPVGEPMVDPLFVLALTYRIVY